MLGCSLNDWSRAVASRELAGARRLAACVLCLAVAVPAATLAAADLSQASNRFKSGAYSQCIEAADEAISQREYSETWRTLKIEAEMVLGRDRDARTTLEQALERFATSVRLRWLGREVYRYNDSPRQAQQMLDEMGQLLEKSPWRYTDPANHTLAGRYLLERGADPKIVLERVYDRIQKQHPLAIESSVASGQLALDKHDYHLAAEAFQQAAKLDATDPDVCLGLARAYASSDAEQSQKWLAAAITQNPRHIPSLLFLVDRHVDAEQYVEAGELLERIGQINPHQPLALAYSAVLAHLDNDPAEENRRRASALAWWSGNPEVDHLIGKKLSQKYRFAEGAEYQRRALALDPAYLPAKIQLCQDLLRLGEEVEGWQLASRVYDQDGYNVVAHNLVTLQESLSQFTTLEEDGLVVRMEAREAQIYGQRVLQLLPPCPPAAVREIRRPAGPAGDRRALSPPAGFCHSHVRPARWSRLSGRLLWPRDHGQQPRRRRVPLPPIGRPCCGTSSVMW